MYDGRDVSDPVYSETGVRRSGCSKSNSFDRIISSISSIEGRVQELRERKRSLDTVLSELQSVIRFNEERLETNRIELDGTESRIASDGSVTDTLLEGSNAITCWTCGSDIDHERIEGTIERLRSLHREKLSERNDLQKQIDELSRRQTEVRQRNQLIERLESRLSTIDQEITACVGSPTSSSTSKRTSGVWR